MIVKGTVVSVELDVQVAKNGGGSYPGARLAYRDEAGAMKEQPFHNNVFKFNPGLKTQLANLNVGQKIVIDKVKEGDYWKINSILPDGDIARTESSNKATPQASPKSTYETPEERAQKQVYIVRQSSITAALTYLQVAKAGKKYEVDEAIAIAKQFENYVFGNGIQADDFPNNEVI